MASVSCRLRVRYAETDQMGVVHHAAYLPWLEVARTEYLRERGLPYKSLEEKGFRMPLLSVSASYLSPALYDDELAITASLVEATPVRFSFEYEVLREGEARPLCRARTDHVTTDLRGRPRRLPADLMSLLGGNLEKP